MARDPFLDDDDADEAQTETRGYDEQQDEAPKSRRKTAAKPAAKKPAPKTTKTSSREKSVADNENGSKLTVTLKGGGDFDAPWIVFYFDSVDEALETLNDDAEAVAELAERTTTVAAFFAKKAGEAGLGKKVGGSKGASSGGTSGGRSSGGSSRGGSSGGRGGYSKGGNGGARKSGPPPNMDTPVCDHDVEMEWREGTTKNGKAFAGFYCAGTDDWDEQCKPVYPN